MISFKNEATPEQTIALKNYLHTIPLSGRLDKVFGLMGYSGNVLFTGWPPNERKVEIAVDRDIVPQYLAESIAELAAPALLLGGSLSKVLGSCSYQEVANKFLSELITPDFEDKWDVQVTYKDAKL